MNPPVNVYAHTPGDTNEWHPLARHLEDVALAARKFAEPFGGGDLAYWIGLWHDLGKSNPRFQDYLQAQHRKLHHPIVPHAIWGAAIAYFRMVKLGRTDDGWQELALPIAGHHA
ncbi:MAG: CRISPR-associated endonuclease Cas3'', partial [Chloroflexi bacterium]|nr:CRISPR-associated endonuclease Cas3'' [Chloroflexota bacterium]